MSPAGRRAVVLLLATVAWWTSGCATWAEASFSRSVSAAAAYGSGTLQPAASVSATCTVSGNNASATVSWTASPSTKVGGYRITSSPATTTVTAASTARSTTVTGLVKTSKYTFTIVTTYQSWVSTGRTTATPGTAPC